MGGRQWTQLTRSIPAHAGEPSPSRAARAATAVYPRPRGGTTRVEYKDKREVGLSPPTRGNPVTATWAWTAARSIPAHAGEPATRSVTSALAAVYPRPRGGTTKTAITRRALRGLSPPTRGNRETTPSFRSCIRSIPAHAGEPRAWRARRFGIAVYPRPRGGTCAACGEREEKDGLSPPTRGNRALREQESRRSGSIPAHAGEPGESVFLRVLPAVYPRPRGGTPASFREAGFFSGLSPPTRGNRIRRRAFTAVKRSIPAHAGEPRMVQWAIQPSEVYPRPRGGTAVRGKPTTPASGLSPPTRGNR